MSLEIYPILCNAGFMDNYAYVLIDSETKVSAVVDAAEEKPIVEFCQKQDIIPSYILTTHHHEDHTNANLALKKRFNAKVVGSKIEENLISGLDIALNDGDLFKLGNSEAAAILASGHTNGHLLWYFSKDKAIFTGDVLFNLCIGGLFEGTPQQMWQSLQKVKSLPNDVRFYPGHEYTKSAFGYLIANQNQLQIKKYLQFLEQCRQNNQPPVGNTLGLEKLCNPYLLLQTEADFVNQMG